MSERYTGHLCAYTPCTRSTVSRTAAGSSDCKWWVTCTRHLQSDDPAAVRETVERVHGVYAQSCPVYRSLIPAFQITSSVEIVGEAAAAS